MISLRTGVAIAAPALILLASSLSSRGGGVESGTSGSPANSSSQMPSCLSCHSGSGPSASRTNAPTTRIVVNDLVLQPNQQTTVQTIVTGGVSGNGDGGFMCEASAGTFSLGSETRIMSNPASITHSNDDNRSWTYSFNAPATPGLVTMTSCGMTCNGGGSSGDEFSFSGFDPNAMTATPVRMFVLPGGVVNQGSACSDGYGNLSVLGANSVPTLGNQNFALELHGATPGSLAFLLAGFNPANFTPIDLDTFGLPGCFGHVANSFFTLTGFTSPGNAERAEGSFSFPISISSSPVLQGVALDVQSAYIDNSAHGRNLPFTFTNGLRVTFQ